MKICMICPSILPVPCTKGGAIEKLMNNIIDENELYKKLDITVVSMWDKEAEEKSKKYINTNFVFIKKGLKYLSKSLKCKFLNLFGGRYITYVEYALKKIKHDTYDYIIVEDGFFDRFKNYLRYFDKSQMVLHVHHVIPSNKETDAIYSKFIGVSEYVANVFKNSSSISDINVLKNGIDVSCMDRSLNENERQSLREKLGFNNDDQVVIFCGRLICEKGILELVKAIKQIDNKNVKLLIVGSINFANEGESKYLSLLKSEIAKCPERIKFTGYIDNSELYKYYKIADLGVVPSVWEEAAGLVIIEMMSAKLPLIVTKTGGIPEYASKYTTVISKETDLVENLKSAIIDKLGKNNDEEIAKSYEYAKTFDNKNFYMNFVQILSKGVMNGKTDKQK